MEPALDSSFLPTGWKWIYDPAIPTNRDVSEAYKKGRTRTTIIDYFIVSPNLEVIENKYGLKFRVSQADNCKINRIFSLLQNKHIGKF